MSGDRLTSSEMDRLAGPNINITVTRSAKITTPAVSAIELASRVASWGKLKTALYNVHPVDRGDIILPVITLTCDNSDRYLTLGEATGCFPNGLSDVYSTEMEISIAVDLTSITEIVNFVGRLKIPEYREITEVDLVIETPLTELNLRKWRKEDRIGGDTGQTVLLGI